MVGSFIYHNGLEIREDRIHDLERLAELGLVQEDDLIGETYVEHSKSEVYHRGRLLGLEEALRLITESE
jgi:hypothetical protein